MYKVDAGHNIYQSIGFDYPGEEAINAMSLEDKKAVYLEGVSKMTHAINILACFPMESKRTFLLWTLQGFKTNYIKILNDLGVSEEEINKFLQREEEKKKMIKK